MHSPFIDQLHKLSAWREGLQRDLAEFARFGVEHRLLDEQDRQIAELREQLAGDRLVLAFVAEFSRGKSELINAIFFADAGCRVLPATPGRTTMCPVELMHDPERPAQLALLPIETRLQGRSLGEMRAQPLAWRTVDLAGAAPAQLAEALSELTRTRSVAVEQARALGFWSDEAPESNPPRDADGCVQVPAWRHAELNVPHPLLRQGLVVLDTPGLNAVGAEPELTLGLLPSAHAVVFVLGADTGVTRSDLALWNEHLGDSAVERFVVLNKIDTLADPLLSAGEVAEQIERQRRASATALDVAPERVFALSARDALASRIAGDAAGLARSRLAAFEAALGAGLLPRQREVLSRNVCHALLKLRRRIEQRLDEQLAGIAEQMVELRGLRGKSAAKVQWMLQRVDSEAADFERCTAQLAALRAVQSRMLHATLATLSSDALRAEVAALQAAIDAKLLKFGARRAFDQLQQRLQQALRLAQQQAAEMQPMLDASFAQLNAEFGFALAIGDPPPLERFTKELDRIADGYRRYLGPMQAWRLATPGFMEQFRRMLVSRLRVVFESAAGEIELWSRDATGQIDRQLREQRHAFRRRHDALARIRSAAGELEQRIAEVEGQERQLVQLRRSVERRIDDLLVQARRATPGSTVPLPLLEAVVPMPRRDAA